MACGCPPPGDSQVCCDLPSTATPSLRLRTEQSMHMSTKLEPPHKPPARSARGKLRTSCSCATTSAGTGATTGLRRRRASPRCRQMETLFRPACVATARYSGYCADLQIVAIRDAGRTERTTMSWADPVIATALAVLAERTATAARTFVTAPSAWSRYDVWLTRVRPPRAVHGSSAHERSALSQSSRSQSTRRRAAPAR